ncbi:MAG: DUF1553 domain-containing protein [Verrucomicrobiota bacterium]
MRSRAGIWGGAIGLVMSVLPAGAAGGVDFSREVLPILSENCFTCHGPDAAERKADLRLDTEEGGRADLGGYAAIVPGDAAASELIVRVFHEDSGEVMPPPKAKLELTASEKAILKRWIEEGAPWEGHWSFQAVERPHVPSSRFTVRGSEIGNEIDAFVGARLEAEGLEFSGEADRETLIRRVTLDLTGLPPTPEEVRAFLEDGSEDAYEKVVDRLLASPRYGETMALQWLDAARYADTDGYQNDGPREMWRWRDWVIEAYNAGMPFDQFTIEQLAGDLLPEPTLEQLIATGFNRNHRYNSEAGLVLEEFLLENAVDRVDTTSTVWMGLTMGCARCHDHKYDPFSTAEYYQLVSFFDKNAESGRAVKFGNSEPFMKAPTGEQQKKLAALAAAERRARGGLGEGGLGKALDYSLGQGVTTRFGFDGELGDEFEGVEVETGEPVLQAGRIGKAATVGGNDVLTMEVADQFQVKARWSLAFWMKPEDLRDGVILSKQTTNTRRPGLAVEMKDGRLQFYAITRWVAGVGALETVEQLREDEWVHVVLTNDGSQSATGMRIYLDGELAETRMLHNTNSNTGGVGKEASFRIGGGVHGGRYAGQVDELCVWDRTLWEDEVRRLGRGRSKAVARDEGGAAKKWYAARMAVLKYEDSLPSTMVMRDAPDAAERETFVRVRGIYDDFGEKVEPGVPEIFPGMPPGGRADRLGFARWVVSGEHPLTARVAVNRYWQKYFGTGLVKTSEDFGVQGERPSHPELLDWLASEFVQTGWDVKAMQKLIVMSGTYRQDSKVTRELLAVDAENRLLARGPRFRLPAHVVRDQALFVGGLLKERLGGPSVSPYQPENLWKEMSNMRYKQSTGDDLYRRSLYTIWKRTVLPPTMAIMDAADRENCAVTPKRTNTPLQALTLLNETTFVESARALAERVMGEDEGRDVEGLVRAMAWEVLGRELRDEEAVILTGAYERYRKDFRKRRAEAKAFLEVGESPVTSEIDPVDLAGATALANVMMNLDEVVNKE